MLVFKGDRISAGVAGLIAAIGVSAAAGLAWRSSGVAQVQPPRAGAGVMVGEDPVSFAVNGAAADKASGVPGWSTRLREAASWCMLAGNNGRAREILENVLLDPETIFDEAEAQRMLAQISFFEVGGEAVAIRRYEESLRLLGRTGNYPGIYNSTAASIMSNLAVAYRAQRRFADCERVVDAVLAMPPTSISRFSYGAALTNKSIELTRRGDYAGATHVLDRRLAQFSEGPSEQEERLATCRDRYASIAGLPNTYELRLIDLMEDMRVPGATQQAASAAHGLLEHYHREGRINEQLAAAVSMIQDANHVLQNVEQFSRSEVVSAKDLRASCLSILSSADHYGHHDKAIDALVEYLRTDTDPRMIEQHTRELHELIERVSGR
ncbi:MAG: hypothetical protein HEQ23_01545 [Tepidisphaera sp.]